jgi:hypothetical protein
LLQEREQEYKRLLKELLYDIEQENKRLLKEREDK